MNGISKTEYYLGIAETVAKQLCENKEYWWQMIQLLPSSYNQKRTIMLNYEVLAGIYPMRQNHKLDEWYDFCKWIKDLQHSEIITGRLPIISFEPVNEKMEGSNESNI